MAGSNAFLDIQCLVGAVDLLGDNSRVHELIEQAYPVDWSAEIPAGATDLDVKFPVFGLDGVLIFFDPDKTGDLSFTVDAETVDRSVNPIHVTSDQITDQILVTNADADNIRVLRCVGFLEGTV